VRHDPESYRLGVMAERRRTTRLALAHVNNAGNPSSIGHSLAHRIAQAGEYLPPPHGPDPEVPEDWSAFGERRHTREVPTFMESTYGPYTRLGKRRLQCLEDQVQANSLLVEKADLVREIDMQRGVIADLKAQLGTGPKRIAELKVLVEQLRRQLSGVIG
jgi:hypothetical protein